jgi:hypothetical protein
MLLSMSIQIGERLLAGFPRFFGGISPCLALHVGDLQTGLRVPSYSRKVNFFESIAYLTKHTGPLQISIQISQPKQ